VPEQNILDKSALAWIHADYVILHAPKPTLLLAATHDFFDINGTWVTFREVKRLYTAHELCAVRGPGGNPMTNTDIQGICVSVPFVGCAAGCWARMTQSPSRISRFERMPNCNAVPDGQVMRLAGERSVFDLNVEAASKLLPCGAHSGRRRPKVRHCRKCASWPACAALPSCLNFSRAWLGVWSVQPAALEKLILEPVPEIQLPALAFIPSKPDGEAFLYLHEHGKAGRCLAPAGRLSNSCRKAISSLLWICATLAKHRIKRSGTTARLVRMPITSITPTCSGQSLIGMWAEDTLACARFSIQLWDEQCHP